MKPSTSLALACFFVSSVAICRGNLGDTEAQCVAKYGAESDVTDDLGYRQVGDKAASFNVKTSGGAMDLRIIFLRGLSCHETYSNADSSRGLSEDQMKAILNAQSAGQKWDKGKTIFRSTGISGYTYGTIDWLRSDGATARFYLSSQSSSQTQTGQIDLSTKYYAYAQHFYDKENGGN
jgi:hypothetical protein